MFDLEQHIREWRQAQTTALGGGGEVIDELESHLREEVSRLVHSGTAAEQAWQTALARLGTPPQLAREFHKLSLTSPLAWMPARLVLTVFLVLALALAWLLIGRWRAGAIGPLLLAHTFTVTLGYTAAFAVGTLAVWAIVMRAIGGWDDRRNESLRAMALRLSAAGAMLTGIGVILGACWAQENLGRLWSWDPREIGGLCVLAWQAITLVCLLRPRRRAGMLLGVAGNVVVSLAWFGPPLISTLNQTHSYGVAPYAGWLLGGFVVSQLLVFAWALVPAKATRREA